MCASTHKTSPMKNNISSEHMQWKAGRQAMSIMNEPVLAREGCHGRGKCSHPSMQPSHSWEFVPERETNEETFHAKDAQAAVWLR